MRFSLFFLRIDKNRRELNLVDMRDARTLEMCLLAKNDVVSIVLMRNTRIVFPQTFFLFNLSNWFFNNVYQIFNHSYTKSMTFSMFSLVFDVLGWPGCRSSSTDHIQFLNSHTLYNYVIFDDEKQHFFWVYFWKPVKYSMIMF